MREGPRSTSSFYGWVMTRDPITERTVVTPPEGADYLETGMQIWALEKKGTSQRAQIWSACIFLDRVWFYAVHVPLAPSEGAVYLVTKMQE